MSVNEIIAELPKLEQADLERVDARLHQLLEAGRCDKVPSRKPIGQALLEFAGKAQGLPSDYSTNNGTSARSNHAAVHIPLPSDGRGIKGDGRTSDWRSRTGTPISARYSNVASS